MNLSLLNINACPGLTLGSSREINWYIPPGYVASDITICGACCNTFNIDASLTTLGPSNCDSFFYSNLADNGIFNYSIWSADKRQLYPGMVNGSVHLPSEGQYRILIAAYGLKVNEYYTWEILSGTDVLQASKLNEFYKSTALSSNLHLSCVEQITLSISVHRMINVDPFEQQGDLGLVQIKYGQVLTEKHGKIWPTFHSNEPLGLPLHTKMTLFTAKPLTYNLTPVAPLH